MPQLPSSPIALPRPMVALAALVAVLVGGTIVLWAHYGTAVFYEMVAAGVAWCL
jgi:CBS-domain-containing membrane protein